MKRKLLIVGHGYLGRHLSQLLPIDTFEITVTTRKISQVQPEMGRFEHVFEFDVTDPAANEISETFDSIVYAVGFDRSQNLSRHQVYCRGLCNFLKKLKRPPTKFIYISSTGVYSQNEGQEIDEQSETKPNRESGQACLAAENELLQFGLDSEVTILRLAGIYGRGRVPNRAKVEAGQNMEASGVINLIHVVDAARIIQHFLLQDSVAGSTPSQAHRSGVFNVSDGNPVMRNLFYREIANQLGMPPQSDPTQPVVQSTRATTNKKISNRKLLNETGFQFEFPDYQAGLRDALRPG